MAWEAGDIAYVVANGLRVKQVTVIRPGTFCIVRLMDHTGGIRIRQTRLFATEEEAQKTIRHVANRTVPDAVRHPTPWD